MFRVFKALPIVLAVSLLVACSSSSSAQESPKKRARELGIVIGVMPTGANNAITDVGDVKVGHVTLTDGNNRTGVTVIIPHEDELFNNKVPAAFWVGNGFGKAAGSTQIQELGNIETPIVLTNTLSIAAGLSGLIDYTLAQSSRPTSITSVNGIVGETNDGGLNDIRARAVTKEHVLEAIANAKGGVVEEGAVGAGTGTSAFGWKGGIGTASRVLADSHGGYTVGVLVQSNFGGNLVVNGVPVGVEMGQYSYSSTYDKDPSPDGSIMMVVATDAPVDNRQLERLCKRVFVGLGRTGSIVSNGSGDYVIAFSTYEGNRVKHWGYPRETETVVVHNDSISPLFMAAIEATEEAVINSLLMAKTTTGYTGTVRNELPVDELMDIMEKYNRVEAP